MEWVLVGCGRWWRIDSGKSVGTANGIGCTEVVGWVSFEKWGERGVKWEESEEEDNGKVDEWRKVEENEEEKTR